MNFLPVLGRELRVMARSSRLYRGRFMTALLAIGIVTWIWMTMGTVGNSAQRAQQIFGALSTFAFIYCLLLGGYVTADSISEEKREGTLGLLFLTTLKCYDVVVGKAAAGSLRAFYSLFAIFPVLTIPILLGGLSSGMVLRMALVLANTLFFSLCLGVLVSACSRHDRKAQAGSFILMLLFTAGFPALLGLLKSEFKWQFANAWFGLSPASGFLNAYDGAYLKNEEIFWAGVAIPHFIAWIAFATSAIVVSRIWQDKPAGAGLVGRWRNGLQRLRGTPEARARYRRRLLEVSPYYWLAARDRLKPFYVGVFLGVCALFWLLLWMNNRRDMMEEGAFFFTAMIVHTAMKIWLALEAGRQIYDDRRNSALELTLSTPLKVRDILEGQFLALLRQFGWALGLIILLDVTAMVLGAQMRTYGAETSWVLSWVAVMIVLLVDAGTIATVGMWLGLSSRRSSRAVVLTLGSVLCIPWLILFALLTYMAIVRFSRFESVPFFIGSYLVISLITDMVLFLWASGNLNSRFREVAVQRFDKAR